jgi:hypothetical protein
MNPQFQFRSKKKRQKRRKEGERKRTKDEKAKMGAVSFTWDVPVYQYPVEAPVNQGFNQLITW